MNDLRERKAVLRRDDVRIVPHPAQVDCGADANGRHQGTIAIVPLLDGDRVAGFEIRCGCGAAAVVECVYATAAEPQEVP